MESKHDEYTNDRHHNDSGIAIPSGFPGSSGRIDELPVDPIDPVDSVDPELQIQRLRDIEEEIDSLMTADKKSWERSAMLMDKVDREKLYCADGYKSFKAWIRFLSGKIQCAESTLWKRLKAGRYYLRYEDRAKEAGKEVPVLSDVKIPADSLVLCEKITGRNTAEADKLIGELLDNNLSRHDLQQAWATVRAEKGARKSRHDHDTDNETGINIPGDSSNDTSTGPAASDLILALKDSSWLNSLKPNNDNEQEEYNYKRNRWRGEIQPKYRCFSEFHVTGAGESRGRNMDVLVLEDITLNPWDIDFGLHCLEIKISKGDLERDQKTSDYADYVDYLWLYVPENLIRTAEENIPMEWGILAYYPATPTTDTDNDRAERVEIVRPAARRRGYHRQETLIRALKKCL